MNTSVSAAYYTPKTLKDRYINKNNKIPMHIGDCVKTQPYSLLFVKVKYFQFII